MLKVFCFLIFCSFGFSSWAETIANPENRHKQFLSYGMLFDPQISVYIKSASRGWAGVGGSGALLEVEDADWKPQLILHASAQTSYQYDGGASTMHVETTDARVGMAWDMNFSSDFRGAIIWTHQSGHIADDVPDPDLIGPDLGNEIFDFRLIEDFDSTWRIGGGFRPFVISNPIAPAFGAEQFAEWYPGGANKNPHEYIPFMAVGFEEYGTKGIEVSSHIQAGYVAGHHMNGQNTQAIRWAIGGYTGLDPRLKYFQFKNHKETFFYAGIFLDI